MPKIISTSPASTFNLLLFRVDASVTIGIGHVMRCLALAQAWQEQGGVSLFVYTQLPEKLVCRLNEEGSLTQKLQSPLGSLQDAKETSSLALSEKASWIIVDGYEFSAEFYNTLRESEKKILAIDDLSHLNSYPVNAILNQNFQASNALYRDKIANNCQLFLGPKFSLIRREFRNYHDWTRETINPPRKLIISLGGSDLKNTTAEIIAGLARCQRYRLDTIVLVGAANPNALDLQKLCSNTDFPCELLFNVKNVAEIMAWADFAITAAGSTIWELASMRLPAFVIAIADNQIPALAPLDKYNFYKALTRNNLFTMDWDRSIKSLFNQISQLPSDGTSCVPSDSWGAVRMAHKLSNARIHMREVSNSDSRLIFDINNAPEIRALAFNKEKLQWPNHKTWFKTGLSNPNLTILIFETEEIQTVGTIRFEVTNQEALVSIVILPMFRGLGIGPEMLIKASLWLFNNKPAKLIKALIKKNNPNSHSCFLKAGFSKYSALTVDGTEAYEYQLDR